VESIVSGWIGAIRVDATIVKDPYQAVDMIATANDVARRGAHVGNGIGIVAEGVDILTIIKNQNAPLVVG
jgi:hypothetical protein